MKQETLNLFIENYENKGDCLNLPKFKKSFVKTFKKTDDKTIYYYPWAVIERIFRSQGGFIEVIDWVHKVEFTTSDYVPNEETGDLALQDVKTSALFIHLHATWQGEEEDEFYPLFDNQNAKVIKTPTALDLNTARQRGMVRLIARISGIGLDIFEQQDVQFGDGSDTETIQIEEKQEETPVEKVKEEVVVEKKKKVTKKQKDEKKKEEALEEIVEEEKEKTLQEKIEPIIEKSTAKEEKEEEGNSFLDTFLKGKAVEEKPEIQKIEETQSTFEQEEFDENSQEYADLLLTIRKTIRDTGGQAKAKEFVINKDKELLSDLSFSELNELKEILNK